jgi:spore germination protein
MRFVRTRLLHLMPVLVALVLIAPLLVPPVRAADSPPTFMRWGSYVPWDDGSLKTLGDHLTDLDVVVSHTASLNADGSLADKTPDAAQKLLGQFKGRALLEVTNGSTFDQDIAHAILTDADTRERTLSALADLKAPWAGVSLDFEDVAPDDRDAYTAFAKDLKTRLGDTRTLSVAVVARTADTDHGFSAAYDYTGLAQAADYVYLMGYAYRIGDSDTDGPVAPLPWLTAVLDYAVTQVPRERLVLAVPAYGYDWRDTQPTDDPNTPTDESAAPRGSSVTYASATALAKAHSIAAPTYDWQDSGVSFTYTDDGGQQHQVWYEDRQTFDQKLDLATRYKLGGIGWWRLGGEDPGAWPALAARAKAGRFFAQTGYSVVQPKLLDYFDHRGGVAFVGYPISNEFVLLGSRVQLFQRAALQFAPDGSVRLLNLLDPDIMPVSHVNGSTLPPPDPAFGKDGPSPTAPDFGSKAPAWITQVVPDTWQGKPVGFGKTYRGTVTCAMAFGDGACNQGLLPLMDLELWGLPTSAPLQDPANQNFVYQRFQRGVLHYDAATGATQGLLLGDVFKALLTGKNLPPDVAQELRASRFALQYDPSKPQSLARPDQLPSSDLSGAFLP